MGSGQNKQNGDISKAAVTDRKERKWKKHKRNKAKIHLTTEHNYICCHDVFFLVVWTVWTAASSVKTVYANLRY